ncbi:MAG: hypothetical protein LKE64_05260 [Solobacterium sp.]|jgi:hypothetical protein|nr:hypothetical protein [Solobacterium sp.]MCH4050260.1 hypothetical protein [Solobacterium sp.]MCH4073881.1 hypothetical protein [Solobacterium sp.]MCI1312834.1 hypothetical protein [Solobacterium sp.]MCI1345365.1 hypothetical protein [Solobacterium sp.]
MLSGLLQGISGKLVNGFKSFFKISICRDGIGHGAVVELLAGGQIEAAGAGLGCDAFQTLFLGIAGLGNGTVELVGAGCVIAFRLVIDLCRRSVPCPPVSWLHG